MNEERMENDSQSLAKQDIAWGVVAANWFLIGVIEIFLALHYGSSVRLPAFLGSLLAVLLVAAIPVAIAYLFARDKKSFRFRLWLTVWAWITVFVTIYGIIRG